MSINLNKVYHEENKNTNNKLNYVKSPLNYVGGKYKLLPQIIPLFPDNIGTFVDLFSGGSNVGINANANKVICNDIQSEVVSLMYYFKDHTYEQVTKEIDSIINTYELSRSDLYGYEHYGATSSKGLVEVNKSSFEQLRNDYNSGNKSDMMFYTMVIYSFNNAIRFNDKGEYNQSCNKRDFNKNIQKALKEFINKTKQMNINFTNYDFRDVGLEELNPNDFVYCDPPYAISNVAYNENNHGWINKDENNLYHTLDWLNHRGIKFALSNVIENKGVKNEGLSKWVSKYHTHVLNYSYGNSYHSSKNKDKESTVEVLITNYIK